MDDLISREQAIGALREKLAEYVPYLYSRKVEEIPLECEMAMRNLPSAEQEQKTGKWNLCTDEKHDVDYYVCSNCGYEPYRKMDISNYCPNCGCRMECEEE